MITYSIIQKSQLEGALRLDAEYYQPKYLEVARILSKYKPLKSFVGSIIHPQEVKREYAESGYLFILSQNLKENYLDFSDKFYIEEKTVNQISKNLLNKGDILTIRTGDIGKSAVFWDSKEKVYASADVIVIKNPKLPSFYISTFLNSKFGQSYLNRIIYGALQPHITPKLLGEIPIPLFDKNQIDEIQNLCETAIENYKQSESLYSQAEDLLLEELGLKDFKPKDELFYIVNLSEAKSAHRADAEYFQPKYDRLSERIKKYGTSPLLDLVQNVAARFNPKSQPTKLFRYVELSNITSSIGIIDGYSEVLGDEAPSRAKRVLKANDVIISSVEGSLEKVALVGKEQEGYLASNGFFQFRSKDILPEVLLVLAKSFVLQMQFEKETAGTILTAVPKEAVKNIVVPKIEKTVQQKIADLVRKSHEARKKAKGLLEEARQKVNELIEK